MTHCNAGTLETAKYGTALAPMYIALEHGWDPKKDVYKRQPVRRLTKYWAL